MHVRVSPQRRPDSGFSLPEVAMAIGIIAIAFVALVSLLPVGLKGFRASMDTANETWIMQGINSMIQTTEWEKIWNPSSQKSELADDIYYYDEEGRLIETNLKPALGDPLKAKLARVYEVKLVIDPAYRRGSNSTAELFTATPPGQEGDGGNNNRAVAVRVVAVIANVSNPKATKDFDSVTGLQDIGGLPKDSPLSIRSFLATQMNAAR